VEKTVNQLFTYATEQEKFWAGEFGAEYIQRNQGNELLASNLAFFSRALSSAEGFSSCVEFGANIGMNLKALRLLYPHMKVHGIEINPEAASQLKENIGIENVTEGSILEVQPPVCDFALIKGVLIHINPDMLEKAYSNIVAATSRYLMVAEYYNRSPVTIDYRGNSERLFKRDFAGEIIDNHPEMALIDYGFVYHRDPVFPQDDVTWFLFEKRPKSQS
jgi:spore coat polysaccharide biosynthesis protein SpsF